MPPALFIREEKGWFSIVATAKVVSVTAAAEQDDEDKYDPKAGVVVSSKETIATSHAKDLLSMLSSTYYGERPSEVPAWLPPICEKVSRIRFVPDTISICVCREV